MLISLYRGFHILAIWKKVIKVTRSTRTLKYKYRYDFSQTVLTKINGGGGKIWLQLHKYNKERKKA